MKLERNIIIKKSNLNINIHKYCVYDTKSVIKYNSLLFIEWGALSLCSIVSETSLSSLATTLQNSKSQ